MIVVTTLDLPGYRIDAVLGEVMGMTVRSANLGANFVASFRSIGGGEINEFTKIVYDSRHEVMHRMVVEAERRGANAVIAMRFDTGSIGQSFTEVCAYGTAVVVTPIPQGQPGATPQSEQLARQASSHHHQGQAPVDPQAAPTPHWPGNHGGM